MRVIFNIFLIMLCLWSLTDLILTNILNIRGFSKFFTTNQMVGFMNKPNFQGKFGGPLDEFYSLVNIGPIGERVSFKNKCDNSKKIIFLGDSAVAGFEVNDNETFVSHFNENCNKTGFSGYNFGVRAYDTHQVIGTYKRINQKIDHNYLFYLIARNDLKENNVILHYPRFVEKFGRIFEGNFYKPKNSFIKNFYYGLRIFISDNFYFTTKLILYTSNFNEIYNNLMKTDIKKIHDTHFTNINFDNIDRTIELIGELNKLAAKNDKKLFIGFYPCLSVECKYELNLEKVFSERLKESKLDVIFFPLVNQFEKIAISKNIKKVSMRFKRDFHLSKLGHKMTYSLLLNNFRNY